jgi:hypothetical protein
MDVSGIVDTENRDIFMWKFNGGKQQQWDLIYQKDWKEDPTKGNFWREFGFYVEKDFHIVTANGEKRYIDYTTSRDLVLKTQNGKISQKWYFHRATRTIKSRAANNSIDIKGSGKSNDVQYYTPNSRWW